MATMMSVRIFSYGGPEALCYEPVPPPTVAGEVAPIRMHAAGFNPFRLARETLDSAACSEASQAVLHRPSRHTRLLIRAHGLDRSPPTLEEGGAYIKGRV